MIQEIAHIEVLPGQEAAFEAGVAAAAPLFQRATGCLGLALQRVIEQPSHYRLVVDWATLENHTVDFRQSADFQAWRALVGACFAAPPQVVHTRLQLKAF